MVLVLLKDDDDSSYIEKILSEVVFMVEMGEAHFFRIRDAKRLSYLRILNP